MEEEKELFFLCSIVDIYYLFNSMNRTKFRPLFMLHDQYIQADKKEI